MRLLPFPLHTPTPWRYRYDEFGALHIVAGPPEDETVICTMAGEFSRLEEGREANARRIVAAMNAVERITSRALERGVVREMTEALRFACCAFADCMAGRAGAPGFWHRTGRGGRACIRALNALVSRKTRTPTL